ncbi:U3 snoRNP-associated protein-like EMB2271 [Diospyros lotus]|uniref:U3 snoRNP-associated protein-like EMB2271 n=1 Tax=Diospyros lotus TaxID=55363 RepID=UPI0022562A0B|nr:U3 snoRNP-associated protein-like EMB2271 [Diospyros lotus]
MKNKDLKRKKASAQKGSKRGKTGFSINEDPFFDAELTRSRRKIGDDDEIQSSDEESQEFLDDEAGGGEEKEEDEEEEETAAEKRKRVAEAYLEKIRAIAKREKEEEEEYGVRDDGEKEGERDSLVAQILQQEQLEESGRVRRFIASRVQKPESADGFRVLVKHRQSVTAVALSEDDLRGFSASKDGIILHWDVDSGKAEKYLWPSEEVIRSHGAKDPHGRATKHSKQVLALDVSSDGRYLATGGLDRHVHLWDTRTREHIQAFPGHRGPVSCLTFRQGTSEMFSGSFDRTIKIWNAEDRAYINTLFGHQSEVLGIDCLRKERALTVGRDRSMHLFKVPEESRLVFRAPASSLECCCFINNDEFLSGSDDGSIEQWSVLRKKPVHIVKNAHALLSPNMLEQRHNEGLPNGHIDSNPVANGIQIPGNHCSSAYSWVSSVTVCRSSDLAASGAGNGSVRLWAIGSELKDFRPLFELPLVGFVNSLAFAKSGEFLVAGVGQEPRLGRWGRVPAAKNGVAVHPLRLL